MKYRTKTFITYFTFLVLLISLSTEGCLKQSLGLNGENGIERRNGRNLNNSGSSLAGYVSSPTKHLITEEVNLSGSEAGNLSLAGNYRLKALDLELKTPHYKLPLKESDLSNYKTFSHIFSTNTAALEKFKKNGFVVVSNPYNPKEERSA